MGEDQDVSSLHPYPWSYLVAVLTARIAYNLDVALL